MFLLLASTPTLEAPREPMLPPAVRAVIDQATASGDASAVAAVVRFAIAAHPAARDEIEALHSGFLAARAASEQAQQAERRAELARSGLFDHWQGQAELGAVRATGSSDHLGLFAALSGKREGIAWSHRLDGRIEIQESNGVRTVDRASGRWQPRRQFGTRTYAYGLAQFERDPLVSVDARYTAALGAGYRLVGERNLQVEIEGGPAFRHTDVRAGDPFGSLAGRASLDLTWRVAPRVSLKQTGTLFIDRDNGNGQAVTALDTRLLGPLSMRLSYDVRYEEDVLRGIDRLDTTSRATLIVGF